jgi:hypothetical protein
MDSYDILLILVIANFVLWELSLYFVRSRARGFFDELGGPRVVPPSYSGAQYLFGWILLFRIVRKVDFTTAIVCIAHAGALWTLILWGISMLL